MANHTLRALRANYVEGLAKTANQSLFWLWRTGRLTPKNESKVQTLLGASDYAEVRDAFLSASKMVRGDGQAYAAQYPRSLHPVKVRQLWQEIVDDQQGRG